MLGKRFTTEQIIQHLREAEVLLPQGKTVAQICKQIGVTEQTYRRWREEYDGIRTDWTKRLKDLKKEYLRPMRSWLTWGSTQRRQGMSHRPLLESSSRPFSD